MVVAEHQDVRQLDGRVPADALARRDALDDRPLRRTNGGGGAGGIVIGVQVDHADQALADGAVFQRALNINQGMVGYVLKTFLFRYSAMVLLMTAVWAASCSVPSSASGRIRLMVEGEPSAFLRTRSQ